LPADWRLKMDVNLMSDNDYLYDFGGIDEGIAGRSLESHGFLARHFGRSEFMGLTAGASFTDDLQAPDDLDRDDVDLQRLGDVRMTLLSRPLPGPLSNFLTAMNVDYTYHRPREDQRDDFFPSIVGEDLFADVGVDGQLGTGTDGEGNGIFDEGEPLMDRGHRVQFTPRVSLPLRIADSVEAIAEVGYISTLFESRAQGFEQQGVATGRLDLRTSLEKDFTALFTGRKSLHLMEPRVGLAHVSSSGSDDPFFIPNTALPQTRLRRQDLRNLTLDSADRIDRYNGTVVGVRNRIFEEPEEVGQTARLLLDTDLSLDYRFNDSEFGWLSLDSAYYPWEKLWFEAEVDYDLEDSEFKEGVFSANLNFKQGSRISADYRYRRDIPEIYEDFDTSGGRFEDFDDSFERINQLGLKTRTLLTDHWTAIYDINYSFELSDTITNRAGLEYLSKCDCWKVGVEFYDHRTRGSTWRLMYTLTGLGRDERLD